MAATETGYRVLDLEAAAEALGDADRRRVPLRRDFDIASFGVNAIYQAKAGEQVVIEHDEVGPFAGGHEELYVVFKGGCMFTIDGQELDAPAGTVVFVGDPAATRASVATEDGTILLAIGGKRGEAFRVSPYETMADFNPPYLDQDYARALAILEGALVEYPGNAGITYNVACMEALLGRPDEALAHLAHAIDGWPRAARRRGRRLRVPAGQPRVPETPGALAANRANPRRVPEHAASPPRRPRSEQGRADLTARVPRPGQRKAGARP